MTQQKRESTRESERARERERKRETNLSRVEDERRRGFRLDDTSTQNYSHNGHTRERQQTHRFSRFSAVYTAVTRKGFKREEREETERQREVDADKKNWRVNFPPKVSTALFHLRSELNEGKIERERERACMSAAGRPLRRVRIPEEVRDGWMDENPFFFPSVIFPLSLLSYLF